MLLAVAAVLGDTVTTRSAHCVGPKVFRRRIALLNTKHLERTQAFYEKHGGKTIILARFVPIIRTFAPFVAGIGTMSYRRFLAFNVIGGVLWVAALRLRRLLLRQHPGVKEHFELVILAIIVISVLPAVIEFFKHRRAAPARD